jgi:hypothetical protein
MRLAGPSASSALLGRSTARMVRAPARAWFRVLIHALNTNPWADGAHRDRPPLDLEQATEVATQPWWSRTDLPVEYVEAGDALDLYEG